MATKELNSRVRNKVDIEETWLQNNPVLLEGEIGFVNDNGVIELKVANGSNTFSDLPYVKTVRLYSENITSSSGTVNENDKDITIIHNLDTSIINILIKKTNAPTAVLSPLYTPNFDVINNNSITIHIPQGYFSNTANTYTIYVIGVPE